MDESFCRRHLPATVTDNQRRVIAVAYASEHAHARDRALIQAFLRVTVALPCQSRHLCFGLVLFGFWMWIVASASAQMNDGFEGGSPRWQLVESDCSAQISNQEISPSVPHSGQTCESLEMVCTNGTYAYLALPVEPCAVIDELSPTLWVQCSSSRIRMGVSVVFPNAQNPVTGGRVQTVLWGSTYDDAGNWQRLLVKDCAQLLAQELLTLRQKFGKLNFEDGAYVDALVLNVYTGPGRYRVKIDELTAPGLIPLAQIGTPVAVDWRARWRWRDGAGSEELRWSQNGGRRLPVWWQYQGESLPGCKRWAFMDCYWIVFPVTQC